jgi:hypothetical protein
MSKLAVGITHFGGLYMDRKVIYVWGMGVWNGFQQFWVDLGLDPCERDNEPLHCVEGGEL